MVLTDPPYNVAYEGCTKDRLTIQNDDMDSAAFHGFLVDSLSPTFENLKPGGAYYVWYATRESVNFLTAMDEIGQHPRQILMWVKNMAPLGRSDYQQKYEPCIFGYGYEPVAYGWKSGAAHHFANTRKETTVIDCRSDEAFLTPEPPTILDFKKPLRNDIHPTMKPVKLFAELVRNSSRKGETVFDPFGGSGTTLIACEELGRKCKTIELDPVYCDAIIRRWEEKTGGKAELVQGGEDG